jgi:mRNA interferase MazF
VLIVQADEFNESRIRTVIVAAITGNLAWSTAPGNVFVPAGVSGLPKESVINVSQLLALDRDYFVERAGRLPEKLRSSVNDGLRMVLQLD